MASHEYVGVRDTPKGRRSRLGAAFIHGGADFTEVGSHEQQRRQPATFSTFYIALARDERFSFTFL